MKSHKFVFLFICSFMLLLFNTNEALAQVDLLKNYAIKTINGDLIYKYSIEYNFNKFDAVYSPQIGELPPSGIIDFLSSSEEIQFATETGRILASVKPNPIAFNNSLSALDFPSPEDIKHKQNKETDLSPIASLVPTVLVPTVNEFAKFLISIGGISSGAFGGSTTSIVESVPITDSTIELANSSKYDSNFGSLRSILPWQQPPNFLISIFNVLHHLGFNYNVGMEGDISFCITDYFSLSNLPQNIEGKVAFLLKYPYQSENQGFNNMYQLEMYVKEKRSSTREWRNSTDQNVVDEAKTIRAKIIMRLDDARK